jgi:hypothetical protein
VLPIPRTEERSLLPGSIRLVLTPVCSLVNTARTFEQTDLGYFYADNFLVLWHQGLRDIANTYVSKIGDSARLFALVSLAMADAGIAT